MLYNVLYLYAVEMNVTHDEILQQLSSRIQECRGIIFSHQLKTDHSPHSLGIQ